MRLFVAVGLPQPALDCVSAAAAEWRPRLASARWVPPANQHVTLKFLGPTDPARLAEVQAACRGVAAVLQPAPVRLAGLGAFPTPRRARVLWVGLRDEHDLLERVAAALDGALGPLGWPPEKRPFHAHVTMARFPSPQPVEGITGQEGLGCDPFLVESFALWQSRLSARGARYESLDAFPLGVS